MAWVVLLVSAVLEAVWATALSASEGFSHPTPAVVFVIALALSMATLAVAVRQIPIGTAYAIWTGVGAALTVTWAMAVGGESASIAKIVSVLGIIGFAAGLKLAKPPVRVTQECRRG